jgi:prophage tail gpP-like protein
MPDISLMVNDQEHKGWTNVSVDRSIEQLAGSFQLGITERFPGQQEKWKIRNGDLCTVRIGAETVINGFVDAVLPSYDARQHSIAVSGRDITGDLVDCSYAGTPNEWVDQTIDKIITDLCAPFGIQVTVDPTADVGKAVTFKYSETDKVFASISKLCKQKAVLPMSTADGKLTLTRTGNSTTTTSLEFGQNIFAGSGEFSNVDRFGLYIIKGQDRGFDERIFKDFVSPKGQATDSQIIRHRPLVIASETPGNNATFQDRARWEASTRAGQSRRYSYTVQGWTQSDETVWPINSLIRVNDSLLDVDETLLIASARYLFSDSGTFTELSLVSPIAYRLIADDGELSNIEAAWESLAAGS